MDGAPDPCTWSACTSICGGLLCMLVAADRCNSEHCSADVSRTGSCMTSIVRGHSKLSATSLRAIAAGAVVGNSAFGFGAGGWGGAAAAGCCDGCVGAGCCCSCGTVGSDGDGCRGCVGACLGGGGRRGVAAGPCATSHRTRSL